MHVFNHVESLAQAVYSAISLHLPSVPYDGRSFSEKRQGAQPVIKYRRPSTDDVEVFHFPQMWGSTALGFGGMGGAAMTKAYTTVVVLKQKVAAVFFDGRHAYTVEYANHAVWNDIRAHNMASVEEKGRYENINPATPQ